MEAEIKFRWRGARFQYLFPNLSWAGWLQEHPVAKTRSNISMDRQLPYGDHKLLKVGCQPYAVGKQPFRPLINLGRTYTLNLRWYDDDLKMPGLTGSQSSLNFGVEILKCWRCWSRLELFSLFCSFDWASLINIKLLSLKLMDRIEWSCRLFVEF